MTEVTSYGDPVATSALPAADARAVYFQWGSVVSGAIVAASCFFVATAFATAIGLAVSSASPTWRDTSVGLVVLSGAWVVLTAIGSFALGGYIAGRTRLTWVGSPDDVHFRDGLYGLVVWGLGVMLGVALACASAASLSPVRQVTGAADPAAKEPSFLTYEIDRLFRSENRPSADDPGLRAEAGRILERSLDRRDLNQDDTDRLMRMVSARAGLAPAAAQQRVQQIVAESRDAAHQVRKSAIVLGFTLAAALVVSAAAAWGAAVIGGRHRDQNITPSMVFGNRRRAPVYTAP
jgi:hypothetical protein